MQKIGCVSEVFRARARPIGIGCAMFQACNTLELDTKSKIQFLISALALDQ